MQQMIFIADLIACSTCFGHHYAHHQELESIIKWLLPVVFDAVKMEIVISYVSSFCVFGIKCRVLNMFVMEHVGSRGGLCVGVVGSFFVGCLCLWFRCPG